jgi:hypothetical protein
MTGLASLSMNAVSAEEMELLRGLVIAMARSQKLVMIAMAHVWQMTTTTAFVISLIHAWEHWMHAVYATVQVLYTTVVARTPLRVTAIAMETGWTPWAFVAVLAQRMRTQMVSATMQMTA